MSRRAPIALAGFAILLAGCPDGVTIVPLYDTELDLCAPEMAETYAARVEDCRARWEADGSCAGVISFHGRLFAEEVRVDADLFETGVDYAVFPDVTRALDALELYGASPYFDFRMVLSLLGGAPDEPGPRALSLGLPTDIEEGWSTDAAFRCALRVAAPPDSQDLSMTNGELVITLQSDDEHAGTFSLRRGTTEAIDGCFHAFTTAPQLTFEETK